MADVKQTFGNRLMFAKVEGTIVATSPIFKYKVKEYVNIPINYVCNSDNLLKTLFVIMSLILQYALYPKKQDIFLGCYC